MGSKSSSFNVAGIKTKPAVFLTRSISESVIKALAEAISGQEFDKAITQGTVKRFAAQYKQMAAASTAKTQAQAQAAIGVLTGIAVSE